MDVSGVAQVGLTLHSAQTQAQLGAATTRQALNEQKQQGAEALKPIQSARVETKPAAQGPGQVLHTVA